MNKDTERSLAPKEGTLFVVIKPHIPSEGIWEQGLRSPLGLATGLLGLVFL